VINVRMVTPRKPGEDIPRMICLNVRSVTVTVTVTSVITIRPSRILVYLWISTGNMKVAVCVRNVRTIQQASTVKLVRRDISDPLVYLLTPPTPVFLVSVEMTLGIPVIARPRAVSVSARRRSAAQRIVPSARWDIMTTPTVNLATASQREHCLTRAECQCV